uniref:Integrase catalytic domain-containing protein n=1 Tax=Fagus sylvatica TaxID=28930 RepID=A0A2N9GES1_FAGSY
MVNGFNLCKPDSVGCVGPDCPPQEGPTPEEGGLQPSFHLTQQTGNSEGVVVDQAESTTVKEEKSTIAEPKMTTKEELEVINLSDDLDVSKPISISMSLSAEERKCLIDLLHEYKDVFAWDYDKMPGIDSGLVAHSLNVESSTKPVVQPMRTFHTEVEAQITQEVKKLLAAGFIKPIQHPRWLSNIVSVKKKNGQIRCCVDFRNFNKACPKDEFPLLNMDLLIDSTTGHVMFSFMDGFSGYNQIRMSTKDAEKTAFCTLIDNFYYTVMPFGLKNVGATYQRTMTAMFHDMMHKEIEDYVDDIVMNPLKCAFGVSAGKFLGFLVYNHGIDVDPAKASAIATMKAPTSHKELKSFLGRLSYIRRFIPSLAALPIVCAPVASRSLRLYLASNGEAIGALVAQEDESGTEKPVYYVSWALRDAETRYSRAERACLALIFLAQFSGEDSSSISHEVPGGVREALLADLVDSIWTLKFDGSSTSNSSGADIVLIREDGETMAKSFKLDFSCSNNASKYEAYITGLAITHEMGIKHLRLIRDSNLVICQAKGEFSLKEPSLAPYRALAQKLEENFDTFEISHAMRCRNRYADALATLGSQISFEGPKVDVIINKRSTPIIDLLKEEFEEQHLDAEDWRTPIKAKLMSPEGVADLKTLKDYVLITDDLYRRLLGGVLARCVSLQEAAKKLTEVHERGFHGDPLRCLNLAESQIVMKEAHSRECGEHQGKKRLYQLLLTLGYYWPTIKKDMTDFVKSCHTCQLQANLIDTHPTSLQNMATPWSFHTWGLDLIGPINPPSGGYIWILVATEYFSKWIKVIPLRKATGVAVANFICEHIITRFGIPHKIISDNGTLFVNKSVREVLEHYQIKHRRSTPYYPQGNGQAEATNRMLLRILSNMVFDYGKGWSSHLENALWAYHGSTKTATGFTPFSLVYGTDAIAPTKLLVPSPRILHGMDLKVNADIYAEARATDLESLEEAGELAQARSLWYHQKLASAYGKTL